MIMKTKILLLFLLGWVGLMPAQEFKIGQVIIFNSYVHHSLTNDYKKLVKDGAIFDTINFNPIFLEPDIKFKIASKDDKYYSVVALTFNKIKNIKKVSDKNLYYNNKIFKVDKEEFLMKASGAPDLPDRLNIGVLALPFKYRPQGNKSFDSDFNLNSTLACRFFSLGGGHLYGQIGAGIGGVELNQVNSKGITDDGTIKANALSMLMGLMIQYKKVQAGIYLGTDFINNQTYYQWQYQGTPWIAFGVGYQLFNVSLGTEAKNNTQSP